MLVQVSTKLLQRHVVRQQQQQNSLIISTGGTFSRRSSLVSSSSCSNNYRYLQVATSAGVGTRTISRVLTVPTPTPIPAVRTTTTTTTTTTMIRQQSTESKGGANNGSSSTSSDGGLWNSASFWGGLGAIAGWGMSGSAIYDAFTSGPEIISLSMTPVLIVYSSLFARWAWIVTPQNLLLCSCHIANIIAQCNQLRRVIEYKYSIGQTNETNTMVQQIIIGTTILITGTGSSYYVRPYVQKNIPVDATGVSSMIRTVTLSDAGPLTVHFWAPLSKWLISGASFLDLYRPTDKISIAQYSALTATGFFFTRYALLVKPVNYMLCAVNLALFTSSAWHLGRKINADYL